MVIKTPGKGTFTADMDSCIAQVMKSGKEKPNAIAICIDSFKKAGKPVYNEGFLKHSIFLEAKIELIEDLAEKTHKVRGYAIHPIATYHPNEYPSKRVYFEKELVKAAPKLIGKPFQVDHAYELPAPNIVTKSFWDADKHAIYFEGTVSDTVAKKIQDGIFTDKVSIDVDWMVPGGEIKFVNGVAPINFSFLGLSFLKDFDPGDPETSVELWESMVLEVQKVHPESPFLREQNNKKEGKNMKEGNEIPTTNVPATPPEAPEKDSHGCIVGQEIWDEEKKKCIAITEPATVGTEPLVETVIKDSRGCIIGEEVFSEAKNKCVELSETEKIALAPILKIMKAQYAEALQKLKEQGGQPKTDTERVKAHFNISDEDWEKLSDEEKREYFDKLPPTGTKRIQESPPYPEPEKEPKKPETEEAEEPEPCPEGQHRDETGKCVPDKPPEEIPAIEEQEPSQEPEKDDHGCIVGKEKWNEEEQKCVLIKKSEPPKAEESVVNLRKQIVDMEAKVATANKERDAAKLRLSKFREAIENVLPPAWVSRAWGMSGAARLLVNVRKTINEFKD